MTFETKPAALDTTAAAHYLGLAPKTLANLRSPSSALDGPPYRRIGRKPVYKIEDLDAWLESHSLQHRNSSDAGEAA